MSLHSAGFASSLLALFVLAACDPSSDDAGKETASFPGDSMGPGDSSDSDGSREPTEEGSDPAGTDEPDEPTFDNDAIEALKNLEGKWFVCDVDGSDYDLFFLAEQRLLLRDPSDQEVLGTYTVSNSSLTLSLPDIGFSETTSDGWVEFDHLVQFSGPGFQCNVVSLDHTASTDVTIVKCPSIKYIPEVGWEDNEFHFGEGNDVYRRRWKELSGVNDTLYGRIYGIYVIVGSRMFMVFPGNHDAEVYLSGTINDDGLYIDELEPEKGPCK